MNQAAAQARQDRAWWWFGRKQRWAPGAPCSQVILRALPKVVFLYPTAVAALLCGVLMRMDGNDKAGIAICFLIFTLLNMSVIAFEFPRTTSVSLFFFAVAVVIGLVYVNAQWIEVAPELRRATHQFRPEANDQFYWIIGGGLTMIILLAVAIARYFDYWEINANQIIHHTGLLHGVNRYSTAGMEMEKDITDVFEYLLLRAGRMILRSAGGHTIVLENVHRVNERELQIQELLSHIDVHDVNPIDSARLHASH